MRKLMAVIFFLSMNASAQDTYEIFTLDKISNKQSENVVVYNVTAGDRMLAKLNNTLKQKKIMTEQAVAQLITEKFKQTLSAQATGLAKAAQYKLKYFPAVVLNEKAVLYGTTDINHLQRYVTQ